MSESILELCGPGEVSGLSFLNGQSKTLPSSALASHTLCRRHNSMLGEGLDVAGLRVFEALQYANDPNGRTDRNVLVSGHDFERWLIQRLCAIHASDTTEPKADKADLNYSLAADALLENRWLRGAGFWLSGTVETPHHNFWDLQKLYDDEHQNIVGARITLMGVSFLAMLWPMQSKTVPGIFRPAAIHIHGGGRPTVSIALSWEDGSEHRGVSIRRSSVEP